MCLAQGPQRSDTGEARTRGLSVSNQALYHWATALSYKVTLNVIEKKKSKIVIIFLPFSVNICYVC